MLTPREPNPHTVPDDAEPVELPVEPDLGPVPPVAHPEDPGVVQPPV
jgi:hypothetical protein